MDVHSKMAAKLAQDTASLDTGFEAMFGSSARQSTDETIIPLNQLRDFGFYDPARKQLHRFRRYSAEALQELADNIVENGVMQPLLVRRHATAEYEILAGHNRRDACKLAGLNMVPCRVMDIDDDRAAIFMTATNLFQRRELSPCELGWAYRVQLEAMNSQGKRNDLIYLTSSQNENKRTTSSETLAGQLGTSSAKIYRYIRLTYLIEQFQEQVDEGKLALGAGEHLSYLSLETQKAIFWVMLDNGIKITPPKAASLKQALRNIDADEEQVIQILKPDTAVYATQKPVQLKIDHSIYDRYFAGKEPKEAEALLVQILEQHFVNRD